MLYKENFKIKFVSESNYKREQVYDQTRCSRMKLKRKKKKKKSCTQDSKSQLLRSQKGGEFLSEVKFQ